MPIFVMGVQMANDFLRVLLLTAMVACFGNQPAPQRHELLLVVDLSNSMSDHQRQAVVGTAFDVLQQAEFAGARFSVFPLQDGLSNADELLAGTLPDAVTVIDRTKATATWRAWKDTLSSRIGARLASPAARKRLTSCYLKSLRFTARFLEHRPPDVQRDLYWLGDLDEDCPDPAYQKYVFHRLTSDTILAGFPKTDALQGIRVIGILLPRSGLVDEAPETDPDAVIAYWRILLQRCGVKAESIAIGTPTKLRQMGVF